MENFQTEFHVTRDENIPEQLILGREFLKTAEVTISQQQGITIRKINTEIKETSEVNDLTLINIVQENEIEAPEAIHQLIKDYQNVQKGEICHPIKTHIVLKGHDRVYHNPRRISSSEKIIVENQVETRLQDGVI